MRQAIDAIDNGTSQYDIDRPPKYVINTSLSSRVGKLNLNWFDDDQSSEKENEAFRRAMELAGSEFLDVSFGFCERSFFLPECSFSGTNFDLILLVDFKRHQITISLIYRL